MIIPIRCFTCGKVLADKWSAYLREVRDGDDKRKDDVDSETSKKPDSVVVGDKGPAMDRLGITKLCCRRHMLSSIDIIDII